MVDGRQLLGRGLRRQTLSADPAPAIRRPHRQRLIGLRHCRSGEPFGLCCEQIRRARLHRGAAPRAGRRPREGFSSPSGGVKTNIAENARTGAGADRAAVDRERAIFNLAARTSPEKAADRIVRGVLRDEERILVGPDAWMIDRIQRWAPVKYWRLMAKMIELLTK